MKKSPNYTEITLSVISKESKRAQKNGERRLVEPLPSLFCWECVEHCGGLSYHNLACCTLTVVHDVFNDIYASIGWTLSAESCTTDGEVEALND